MRKLLAIVLSLACLLVPAAVVAQDSLSAGADNVSNTQFGQINYPFQMCWDGTYWDRQTCTSTSAPSYVRIQDGTTATLVAVAAGVAANAIRVAPSSDAYFMVSRTTAANAQANPIYVAVSDDGTANSAANPIAMLISDGADANAQGHPVYCAVSDDTAANSGTNPIAVQITDGVAVRPAPWAKFDDDAAANCVAITTASVQFTLPAAGWYHLTAVGNAAYILCGANPTATTTVTTGFSTIVPEGAERTRYLNSAKCAVIGASAAGSLCFEHLNTAL